MMKELRSIPKKVSRSQPNRERFFRDLSDRYNQREWLTSDPVQFAHRYSDPASQEVVAFLSAAFAYGSVVLIHRALEAILAPMGKDPARFVLHFDGQRQWRGFYHRFHTEEHLVYLIRLVQKALLENGSLGALFKKCAGADPTGEKALDGAARWFQKNAKEMLEADGVISLWPGMRFFFNAPSDGSACKRMAMFLRWMVRRDEIDFGLWDWLKPDRLVIPVDTHVGRISYYLGLRGGNERRAPNWKMAVEITESLKKINPADPVCYDFAIARLGILDICKKEYAKSICEKCPVESACRFSNLRRTQ